MRGKGKIVGIVITLVCLGLAFYQVNLQELLAALAGADYRLIVPAMAALAGRVLCADAPLADAAGWHRRSARCVGCSAC